jgi:hypothetical protein
MLRVDAGSVRARRHRQNANSGLGRERPATSQIYETGGAMSSEQTSSVTLRVSDFTDSDGIEYTEIEVVVEMDGADIRETSPLVKTLERPLTERK